MRLATLVLFGLGLSYARRVQADSEPEILIAGEKSSRPARDPTVAASRVDEADLTRPGASAATVLAHVPGVQVSATGTASDLATASIRGASSAQTPVYLAGIRLNDDVTGTADLSLVPLWMLSSAEVYRGNAPADAERMGIGGAVYFEPRKPRETRVGAGGTLGSFGESSGFVGAEIAESGSGGDGALVAYRGSRAQNDYPYLNDAGTASPSDDRTLTRPNADYSAREAWAIGRTMVGQHGGRITTVFNAFDREQGVTGLVAVPALAARAESARVLAGLSAKVPCSGDPSCELELTSQVVSARTRLSDPRHELGLLVSRVDSEGARVAEGARVTWSGDVFRALLGTNVEFERLALDGATAIRATRGTLSARAGLMAALTPQTELSGLAVLTCDTTRGPAQADDCAALTPEGRLGVREKWGPFELRSNLGRYARVPTLGELYGISPIVRGSSALVPEQGVAWDLGTRWEARLGPISSYVDAFGFARHVSELIAYRRSSLGAVQPYNVGSARVLGGELEAGAAWSRHLRSALTLTLLDPRDTTPGRTLTNDVIPYQSRLVGSLFSEAFIEPRSRALTRTGVDARVSYRGSRLADPAGLIVLPDSTELDLGASALFEGDLSVRGAVDDVFDAHHFDFIGYPVPGRSFHLSVEAWW